MSETARPSASPHPEQTGDFSDEDEAVPVDQLVPTAKALHDKACHAWRRLMEPDFLDAVSQYHQLDMQVLDLNQQLSKAVTEPVRRQLKDKRERLRRERNECTRRTELSREAVELYHGAETLQFLDEGAQDAEADGELSAADREQVANYLEGAMDVETDGNNALDHHGKHVKALRHGAVAARSERLRARRMAAADRRAERAGATQSTRRHTFQRRSSGLSQAHVPSPSPEHDDAHALGKGRPSSRDGNFRRALLYFEHTY